MATLREESQQSPGQAPAPRLQTTNLHRPHTRRLWGQMQRPRLTTEGTCLEWRGGGGGTRAPGGPSPRRPPRVWPQRGSEPGSRPAAARSRASRSESVLAGGGSAESETRTDRQDRPEKREVGQRSHMTVSAFGLHARKERQGGRWRVGRWGWGLAGAGVSLGAGVRGCPAAPSSRPPKNLDPNSHLFPLWVLIASLMFHFKWSEACGRCS